jgi:cyclopropane-fatty-acyl-phospholipid synthase
MFGKELSVAEAVLWPSYALDQPVVIRVTSPLFYLRILTGGLLGLCQAYMHCEIEILGEDEGVELTRFLLLLGINDATANTEAVSYEKTGLVGAFSWMATTASAVANHVLNRNTLRGARRNIEAHYDLSNDMFATFLGPTWMYSSAFWPRPEMSLDEAQVR